MLLYNNFMLKKKNKKNMKKNQSMRVNLPNDIPFDILFFSYLYHSSITSYPYFILFWLLDHLIPSTTNGIIPANKSAGLDNITALIPVDRTSVNILPSNSSLLSGPSSDNFLINGTNP